LKSKPKASNSRKSHLRKEKKRRLVTNDLNKSAAMETIEKRVEKKVPFSDIILARCF
jgi:hypothetical protein